MFLCIHFIFFLFPHLAQYGYSPMAGYPSNIDTMVENERNQYESPRSFDCDTCGRSFSHKRSLKRHKWQCEKTRELVSAQKKTSIAIFIVYTWKLLHKVLIISGSGAVPAPMMFQKKKCRAPLLPDLKKVTVLS